MCKQRWEAKSTNQPTRTRAHNTPCCNLVPKPSHAMNQQRRTHCSLQHHGGGRGGRERAHWSSPPSSHWSMQLGIDFLSSSLAWAHTISFRRMGSFDSFSWHCIARMAALSSDAVFCLWARSSKCFSGDCSGSGKASSAMTFSISSNKSPFSSPAGASCSSAKVKADSTSPLRISSMNSCFLTRKCRAGSVSRSSGLRSLTREMASVTFPSWRALRIAIRSVMDSKSTPGGVPDSFWNSSAASLYPSITR
mmetsp:Transcript_130799/g.226334  ORF Transcript_130799/g.226334 Transcript_130799/m.226334 type:complete len:250 (+) Transcript_130799:846-1595(+)